MATPSKAFASHSDELQALPNCFAAGHMTGLFSNGTPYFSLVVGSPLSPCEWHRLCFGTIGLQPFRCASYCFIAHLLAPFGVLRTASSHTSGDLHCNMSISCIRHRRPSLSFHNSPSAGYLSQRDTYLIFNTVAGCHLACSNILQITLHVQILGT